MTQPLLTADQHAQLLANGMARAAGQDIDPLPVVRFFALDAHATWLLASLDPADGDTAYDLIDVGLGMPELGTVKLSELASIVGPLKRPIERDLYFTATRTLSGYARLARFGESSRHRRLRRIVSFSVLLKTVWVSICTLARKRCGPDANSHDLWCGLRHRVPCRAPFSGCAAVAFGQSQQRFGANQS